MSSASAANVLLALDGATLKDSVLKVEGIDEEKGKCVEETNHDTLPQDNVQEMVLRLENLPLALSDVRNLV